MAVFNVNEWNRLQAAKRAQRDEVSAEEEGVEDAPVFTPPAYDRSRIRQLSREISAPQTGRLRRGLRETLLQGQYENPNVRGLVARRALEGFGQSLGDVTAKARGAAATEYGQEYQSQFETEKIRFASERAEYETGRTEELQTLRDEMMARFSALRGGGRDRGRGFGEFAQQQRGRRYTQRRPSRLSYERDAPQGLPGFQGGGRGDRLPSVNPQFWPQGYTQQQAAVKLSQEHNVPLDMFYGDKDPEQALDDFIATG